MKSVILVLAALLAALATPMPVLARQGKETKVERPTTLGNIEPVRISRVLLDSAPGVFVSDGDRQLILGKIEKRVNAIIPAPATDAPVYRLSVILTRFSHGEAAARFALIGLGSIHVEGKVQLLGADGKQVAEFMITKGLVLGGLAGGFSTASSVYDRFANAVVAPVTPHPAPPGSAAAAASPTPAQEPAGAPIVPTNAAQAPAQTPPSP